MTRRQARPKAVGRFVAWGEFSPWWGYLRVEFRLPEDGPPLIAISPKHAWVRVSIRPLPPRRKSRRKA